MVEKDTVYKGKVRHKGRFNFAEFYRFCYTWLIDEDYLVTEKTYTEKVNTAGKEVLIEWEGRKKISDYFRFILKVNWRILAMTDVDVQKDGIKLKMNQGDMSITFTAVLEKDYEHRWESSGFMKFLRGVYDRYIVRGRIEDYEGKIFGEVDEYIAQAKSFLALEGKH